MAEIKENKVTLFLMTLKGYRCLNELINAFNADTIDQVIYAKDTTVQNDYSEEIIGLCEKYKIPCTFRKDAFAITTKWVLAVSWKWMIEHPDTIILHDSILPRYRGWAPLVTALLNEDSCVGVTALVASDEYDKGVMIGCNIISISYPIKVAAVIELICGCYEKLINTIVKQILDEETIWSVPQIEAMSTYSLWLDEEDYRIDWTWDAEYIKRFVDSTGYPYKGASCYEKDVGLIRIIDCEVVDDVRVMNRERHIGKVIFVKEYNPIIICGSGLLKITKMVNNDEFVYTLPKNKFRTRLT